jgi:hypothetical protein
MDTPCRESASPASCWLEPDLFQPYQPTTVRVHVRPCSAIRAGSVISCQLPNSFHAFRITQSHTEWLQVDDPTAPHHVSIEVRDALDPVTFSLEIAARELITDTRGGTRHGQRVLATLEEGTIPAGAEVIITFARMYSPWVANQEEYFYLDIDGEVVEPWPTFRVIGGEATWHRLIVPSSARPNEPFRVLLVTLDRYDNISSSAYAGVTLALEGGAAIETNISCQGRYETKLRLAEEGVFRMVVTGLRGDSWLADGFMSEGVVSNPIRITDEPMGPYWGDIHVHTHISGDALGNEPYQYAKDASGLDFAGVCDHGNADIPKQWERIKGWAREHHEPGRFVTILGYEGGVSGREYHHNVYYPNLDVTFADGDFVNGCQRTRENLEQHLAETGALSQLHQSGTCSTDMREPYFPSTRLLEIYSHWGQSEYYNPDHALSYEFNRVRRPETRMTISERGPFYARDAWAEGKRYVTIASSDDHNGQAGKAHRGVAAVYSSKLTRKGIFGGLRQGACYGTTGERILLDFRINGRPMGSEITAEEGQKLEFAIEVYGTNVLSGVEVFRYRFDQEGGWEPVYDEVIRDRGLRGNTQRDLSATFSDHCTGPAVYYLRVRQKHLVRDRPVYAWSTPIWVLGTEAAE